MTLPMIDCAGSPYAVGYQHGQQAARQIEATFRRWCRYDVGDAAARAALVRTVEANVAARLPGAIDEMRGIADGAVQAAMASDAINYGNNILLAEVLGGGDKLLANSRERFERLDALAGAIEASLETLQALFRDHARPGGFCQHGQGDLHTVAALIVAPRLRQLWIMLGPPCRQPFESIQL